MQKLISFFKKTRPSQLLTVFLLGVVFSISTAYGPALLQAKTLNKFESETPVRVQIQASSPDEAGANALDTKVNLDKSSIKLAGSSNPSFTNINWSTVAQAPVGRSEAAGIVADGQLYVFGGYANGRYRPTSRSDVYNPANNTWTQIRDLPTPLTHVGIAVDGRKIYLAGGYPGTSNGGQLFATRNVWRYNIDTNTWSSMPLLPQARGSGELSVLGRELHFFGGVDSNRADKGNHWVLSLDGGTSWTTAAPLPNPRSHMADAVIGSKIYAIGGQHNTDANLVTQTTVNVWDPVNPNTWTEVASLPRGRSHISGSTFVMDNRIIVIGGEIAHQRSVPDVTAYDPLSNSWRALTPLPAARYSGVAGNIGNQIFYTGGGPRFQVTTYKGLPQLVFPDFSS